MKYNTSVITYFVIPAGATSGQRIVLDGVAGEIDLYNAANELVGRWQPLQFGVFAGSPNAGRSIQILPNAADDSQRPAMEYRVTVNGNAAIIDATDDGTGSANLNLFSASYLNTPSRVVNTSFQAHTGFTFTGVVDANGTNPGGWVRTTETQVQVTVNSTAVTPVTQTQLLIDGSAHTVTVTPDSTQTGGIKTPSIQALYSAGISSAFLKVLGAGVWAVLTMQGGYVAGNPAPAITLLPDGTMAFRGTMTTRAAPVSGDTCMTTGASLAPSATKALLVFTLLNPNTVLQLNWNTNGTFQLFGGGPNPPANTGVSLDSIPPIPVAF